MVVEIPTFIFKDRSVAVLESLVEYLHDIQKMNYHEIAILLNRNDRTIWTVYHRAKKKRKR
jgi:DNA-directed RNA polymerase specialized sigma24 family protein